MDQQTEYDKVLLPRELQALERWRAETPKNIPFKSAQHG